MQADLFEAVLAAVYLDRGIVAARRFVRRQLRDALRAARDVVGPPEDYKTRLQEATQARLRLTPSYRIVASTGPDHARHFEIEALVEGEVLGLGRGSSRKRAEQEAARHALTRFQEEADES